jgi:hypothetical protein
VSEKFDSAALPALSQRDWAPAFAGEAAKVEKLL